MSNITNFFSKTETEFYSEQKIYFGVLYKTRITFYSDTPFFIEKIKLAGVVHHILVIFPEFYTFKFYYEAKKGEQKQFFPSPPIIIKYEDSSNLDDKFSQIENLQITEAIYSLTIEYNGHNGKTADGLVKYIELKDIQLYGKPAPIDTLCRIKINNRIYSISSTQENSQLKIKIDGVVKNIKLLPLSESKNSKLRVKTKSGIMAIDIRDN